MPTLRNLDLDPLQPFGVSITGLDCSAPVVEKVAAALIAALTEHLVVVIRGQQLSVAEQIRFTSALGTPEMSWDQKAAHPDDARVQVIDSSARPPGVKSTSQVWHTDQSFTRKPSFFTILHNTTTPTEGGQTQFADMRAAYDALPADLQDRLAAAYAVHSYNYDLGQVRMQRYSREAAAEESERFPDVRHPLIRIHPITGRRALYLNQLCVSRIDGLDEDGSARQLTELYEYALAIPMYVHTWQPGDLLLWDNPSLMHRGTPTPEGQVRVLHRTTTEGPTPQPAPTGTDGQG